MPGPPKTLQESIAAVCRMPVDYRVRGNISWNDLEKETAYIRFRDRITPASLEEELRKNPELVGAWVDYSEDQRSRDAWCLEEPSQENGRAKWTLGYFRSDGKYVRKAFDDGFSACATFIKCQLDKPPRDAPGCLSLILPDRRSR